MDKFENALFNLEDLETPYDPIMATNNFLNNIEDEVYKITIETLGMDDYKTHANYLNKISRKSIKVEDLRAHLNLPRRFIQARVKNNTNSNTNHQIKTNNYDGQVKWWLPKEK